MDLATGFLLYALAFRLAIIAVGVFSIALGYKLFVRGVMGGDRTDAEAQLGEIKLTVRNAAPGTCFALFGVVIIVAMQIQGSPELTLKTAEKVANLEKNQGNEISVGTNLETREFLLAMKGIDSMGGTETANQFNERVHEAATFLGAGRKQEALKAYSKSLEVPGLSAAQAAVALDKLARLYLERDEIKVAETLARLAVLFAPAEASHYNGLARVLLKQGNAEALGVAQHAVELDPELSNYMHTLALSLEAAGKLDEAVQIMRRAVALDEVYTGELERMTVSIQ
jgi:tetratricopeptide (TPR) repeat protein